MKTVRVLTLRIVHINFFRALGINQRPAKIQGIFIQEKWMDLSKKIVLWLLNIFPSLSP